MTETMTADPRLIVPLDLPTVDEARDMVERLLRGGGSAAGAGPRRGGAA